MTAARVTATDVLDLLQEHPGRAFEATEIAYHFNISYSTILPLVRQLADAGTINRTQGRRKINRFHVGELALKAPCAAVAAPHVGEVVPGFKPDMWKPPMQGYEASLRAVAARAMATRK